MESSSSLNTCQLKQIFLVNFLMDYQGKVKHLKEWNKLTTHILRLILGGEHFSYSVLLTTNLPVRMIALYPIHFLLYLSR